MKKRNKKEKEKIVSVILNKKKIKNFNELKNTVKT